MIAPTERYVRELLAEYAVWCNGSHINNTDRDILARNKKRIEDHFVELFAEWERFAVAVADRIGR